MRTGDWSLRANGATYYDHDQNAQRLFKRIENSSASVTGIAGERGAGKSSFAQHVLSKCEEQEAFAVLIQSPTGYEPREFLVSIFQRICEEVVARIEANIQAPYLAKRSRSQLRRLRFFASVLFVLAGALVLSVLGYGVLKTYELTLQSEMSHIRALLEEDLSYDPGLELYWNRLVERSQFKDSIGIWAVIGFQGLVSLCVAIILVYIVVVRMRPRIRHAKDYSLEPDLLRDALHLLERLRFETKQSRSTSIGTSMISVGVGKTLASRPLSLPGIAAELIGFFRHLCRVYPYVVVCIDELDKITCTEDLEGLLRAIKGVLGQDGTHFVLTVSEDALSRFAAQRERQKGMLESAFETIIALRRVAPIVACRIIRLMYDDGDRGEAGVLSLQSTRLMLWLFGGGVPREIKRNVLTVLELLSHSRAHDPISVWKALLGARLTDLEFWVMRFGADDSASEERFLSCLERTRALLDGCSRVGGHGPIDAGLVQLVAKILELWISSFRRPCFDRVRNGSEVGGSCAGSESSRWTVASRTVFGGAVIDILLAVAALRWTTSDLQESHEARLYDDLLRVFELGPDRPRLAWKILEEHLGVCASSLVDGDTSAVGGSGDDASATS